MSFPIIVEDDILRNLIENLPAGWFGDAINDESSVIRILLNAYISTAITMSDQLQYCYLNIYLDSINDAEQLTLFARDYFGKLLPQLADEPFETYRKRIKANLLSLRCTRPAMENALFILTGFHPRIFEPWRPSDTGGYGGESSTNYSMGYSTHGAYGSGSYPYQCFIDVTLPINQSMGTYPVYLGSSSTTPYYGIGAYSGESGTNNVMYYGGESLMTELIKAAQVYQTINITKLFGTICWVSIKYASPI